MVKVSQRQKCLVLLKVIAFDFPLGACGLCSAPTQRGMQGNPPSPGHVPLQVLAPQEAASRNFSRRASVGGSSHAAAVSAGASHAGPPAATAAAARGAELPGVGVFSSAAAALHLAAAAPADSTAPLSGHKRSRWGGAALQQREEAALVSPPPLPPPPPVPEAPPPSLGPPAHAGGVDAIPVPSGASMSSALHGLGLSDDMDI